MAPTVQGITAADWQDILVKVDRLRNGVQANLARFADPDEPDDRVASLLEAHTAPALTVLQGGRA